MGLRNKYMLNGYTIEYLFQQLKDEIINVLVPEVATYTDPDIRIFGVKSDLNNRGKIIEDSANYRYARVYLSIPVIISIYADGYPIRLVKPSDSYRIIDILDKLVADSNSSIMVQQSELKEIIDSFAKEVLDLNDRTIETEHNREINTIHDKHLGTDLFYNVNKPSNIKLEDIEI